jgi:hypothetical protein
VQTAAPPSASRHWRLSPGLVVVERDPSSIQVGAEVGHRILIRDAPPGTGPLLTSLTGQHPVERVVGRIVEQFGGVSADYFSLLERLRRRGFLVAGEEQPATVQAPLASESVALTMNAPSAGEAMRRRLDAVVVVVGSGRVATTVSALLIGSGVGHLCPQPTRSLRPSDLTPAGLSREDLPGSGRMLVSDPHASPRPEDRDALAAMILRIAPHALLRTVGGRLPPTVAVLATDGPPPLELVRQLVHDGVPHLLATSGELRGVVGPFVLPGRTSCGHCHDLSRVDLDPGWPRVRLALARRVSVPPVVLTSAVAALAASEVLEFVDGGLPASIDGTFDLEAGNVVPRRRSWQRHPRCLCHTKAC